MRTRPWAYHLYSVWICQTWRRFRLWMDKTDCRTHDLLLVKPWIWRFALQVRFCEGRSFCRASLEDLCREWTGLDCAVRCAVLWSDYMNIFLFCWMSRTGLWKFQALNDPFSFSLSRYLRIILMPIRMICHHLHMSENRGSLTNPL